jgi:hypothetical protein
VEFGFFRDDVTSFSRLSFFTYVWNLQETAETERDVSRRRMAWSVSLLARMTIRYFCNSKKKKLDDEKRMADCQERAR